MSNASWKWATPVRTGAHASELRAARRWGVADEQGLLSRDYMGRVIDLDYPAMRRFFRTERIADSGMMRRIANLEYLAERLGSRLAA